MVCAVKKVNNVLIEAGVDCLGNEEKRFGATPDTRFGPARNRAAVASNTPPPTGQACAAPLPRKCRKAAHAVTQGGEDRQGIGKPTNVMKELAATHGGKAARDFKAFVSLDDVPEQPVDFDPATDEDMFCAYLRALFPGWREDDNSGFALGHSGMADRLAKNLIESLEIKDSEAPLAMAVAMAEHLAEVTDGDIRHARQVFDYMQRNEDWLHDLLQPEHLDPAALLQQLETLHAVRDDPADGVPLDDDMQQALALQVAVSLSRHTHDFQALRMLLHPEQDFSPDDTRVPTKPAEYWLDARDPDCADGLLQQALQALGTMYAAPAEEDFAYAQRCLTMLCALRNEVQADQQQGGTARIDAHKAALTPNQRRELFAWNQGLRSVDDIRAVGDRMRKNCIWLWRSQAIKKSRVLTWTPAPLRSLFWGKAPYQASKMGDGGASMKHAPEMQGIYEGMVSTLLLRLRHHLGGAAAGQNGATLRNDIASARQQGRPQVIHDAIDRLFWLSAAECFPGPAQRDVTRAIGEALRVRLVAAGVQMPDVTAYLRHLGLTPNADAPLTQLIEHCLERRFMAQKFQALGLMAQGPLMQAAAPVDADAPPPAEANPPEMDVPGGAAAVPPAPNDVDPRTATQIFEALRRIEKIDLAPRDMTIDGLQEHMVRMVHQNQDNTWRAEEKLGSGVNGVIFWGLAKFNSLGLRLTGIGAASAYAGVESKNWGMEITLGRRTHRNTGFDVRYVGGSEEEFGEHFKASLVASVGYDSEHVDTAGIKILVRRDFDDKGGIRNAEVNGQPVLGEDGKPVQAHRHESQRVLDFFANAARSQQFAHVGTPGDQAALVGPAGQHQRNGEARLRAYDPLDVFTSFANEFFDSKLVSVSQTHATSSTQKTSVYAAATARAALERNGKKFQIGASATLLQGSNTYTKSATRDQNGKQALNMVSYNHAVDVRSGIGASAVVIPGFSPDTALPTSASPVGLGVTVTYRARETRGQLSLLKKDGLTDTVFCYSGENYKRPEEFIGAVQNDWAAWVAYFGDEARLQAALAEVVATAQGQNVVLMVRRRLRAHIGPQLDALEAQMVFQRSVAENPRRTEKQRARAQAKVVGLQNAMEALLSRADSFEPFGLGSFSRVEKSRSRGISYYFHFVNTQSISATQELTYKARKPVERNTALNVGMREYRSQKMYQPLMERARQMLHLHEKQVAEARALVRAENRDDPRGQAVEDARHLRRHALRRLRYTERLCDGWQQLIQLQRNASLWRMNAKQLDGEAANAPNTHAIRLGHVAGSLEGLLRHIHSVEDLRASSGGIGLVEDVSNPSYHLLRLIGEYANALAAEAHALALAPAADEAEAAQRRQAAAARREVRRRDEETILQEINTLLVAVADNARMMESTHYDTVTASGWKSLHQLAGHWEQLHAATLRESAAEAAPGAPRRRVDTIAANRLDRKAGRRQQLDQDRVSYNRLAASDLSDDEKLVTAARTRQHHTRLRRMEHKLQHAHAQLTR